MKKQIIITAVLLAGFVSVGQGQTNDDEREKLVFGAKAGANLSNVYDASGENFKADPKMGFVGGAFLGIPIGKYLGIQPELLFSQKGYQSTGTMLGASYADVRTTSFLDVPLQVQFKPSQFVTFLGGVQYSYLLNQKDVLSYGSNYIEQYQAFKNDNIRRNIFGAVLGVDVTINHFIISSKACWDLQNNAGDGSSSMPRYKNVWLQLGVGFRLYN